MWKLRSLYISEKAKQNSARNNGKCSKCFQFLCNNRDWTWFFNALTFPRSLGRCWKPRPPASVFNTSLRDLANVNVWKTTFDPYIEVWTTLGHKQSKWAPKGHNVNFARNTMLFLLQWTLDKLPLLLVFVLLQSIIWPKNLVQGLNLKNKTFGQSFLIKSRIAVATLFLSARYLDSY